RRMTSGGLVRTRSSAAAPVSATSTWCSGAGKLWRTCSGITTGSSSTRSKCAMFARFRSEEHGVGGALSRPAFYTLSCWLAHGGAPVGLSALDLHAIILLEGAKYVV